MKCSDIQTDLRLYSDGVLSSGDNARVKTHLAECPICRQAHADILEIQAGLRRMERPAMSFAAQMSLKNAITAERRRTRNSLLRLGPEAAYWLKMQVMPYGVGALASVVIGMSFLVLMYNAPKPPVESSTSDSSMILASNTNPFVDPDDELTPADYARTRLSIASESPSVNPQGALVALTKSLVRGGMKDDEVVVVADVFGNGLARITEVVEPSRDQHAVAELQKALYSDPAYAPFVPASMDKRSNTMQVVLRFQSVDVKTGQRRR